ncbi:MAG: MerR family transcriptional regulator [Cellulosilyticaceae bacterium]
MPTPTTPLLKTNEFAKLFDIHKKTLFYYDEIDLFKPYYVDTNGYRYYSYHQYDTFSIISILKEIGMPLKEIKVFINERNPNLLVDRLMIEKQKLKTHIKKLQHMEQLLETVTTTTEAALSLDPSTITLVESPEEYLTLSSPITAYDDHSFFQVVADHFKYCIQHHIEDGHPVGAIVSKEHLKEKKFTSLNYLFTKTNTYHDTPFAFVKPSGYYVVGYNQGNYDTSPNAYERLLHFIAEHHLTICGASYEETLLDHLSSPNPENYLTRIAIQVAAPTASLC